MSCEWTRMPQTSTFSLKRPLWTLPQKAARTGFDSRFSTSRNHPLLHWDFCWHGSNPGGFGLCLPLGVVCTHSAGGRAVICHTSMWRGSHWMELWGTTIFTTIFTIEHWQSLTMTFYNFILTDPQTWEWWLSMWLTGFQIQHQAVSNVRNGMFWAGKSCNTSQSFLTNGKTHWFVSCLVILEQTPSKLTEFNGGSFSRRALRRIGRAFKRKASSPGSAAKWKAMWKS